MAFIHVSRKKRINALSIFKQTSKHDDVLFPFKKESKKVMLLLSNFIVAVEKSMYGKERERGPEKGIINPFSGRTTWKVIFDAITIFFA